MSEENKTITQGDENKSTNAKEDKRPETVPYSTFTDARKEEKAAKERVADLESQLSVFEKAKNDKIEADLIAKGDYDTAINKYKAQAEEYVAYKEAKTAKLIEQLPENARSIAEGMSLEKLEEFVALQTINKVKPREDLLPGGRRNQKEFGGYKDRVEQMKMDPEGYAEWRKQQGYSKVY